MTPLRPKTLPLLLAAALLHLPLAALAERVCELGDARQFSAITELCPVVNGLARIQIGHRWGFVDTSGKLVIAPQFDAVNDFSEGVAAVQVNEKWGVIDRQGKWIVQPTLLALEPFSHGLASAHLDGKDGYIDRAGKWVLAPQFDSAGPFSATTAVVRDAAYNYAMIDRSGRVIKRFSRDVRIDDDVSRTGLFRATVSPPTMLVNVDGRRLPFPEHADNYQDGLFIASAKVKRGDSEDDIYGLMDTAGKWVLPAQFRSLKRFDDKLAIAVPYAAGASTQLHGLVDRKGRFVVEPVYETLSFNDKGQYLGTRAGSSKTEVLDAKGKPMFTVDCEEMNTTDTAGAISVMAGCKQMWVVHRTDGLIKTLAGEWTAQVQGDFLLLEQQEEDDDGGKGGSFEIYRVDGKRVAGTDLQDRFLGQRFNHVGLVPASARALPLAVFGNFKSNLTGFLTRDFKLVTRPDWEYDSVLLHYSGTSGETAEGPLVMKGPKGFGAVDLQGNWVVPPVYEELSEFEHGLAYATNADYSKVIVDSSGKTYPVPEDVYRLRRSGALMLTGETDDGEVTVDLGTGKQTPVPEVEPDKVGDTQDGLTPTFKDGKWGLVDAAREWVLAPSLRNEPKPLLHKERLAGWIHEDAGLGLLDPQGRQLTRPVYSALKVDPGSGMFIAQQDGHLDSVLGADGKQVLAPINGSYTGLGDGWFKADMEDLHGLLDGRGEWAVKPGRVEFQLDTPYYLDPRPYAIAGQEKLVDFAGRVSTPAAPLTLGMDEKSHWWWTKGDDDDEGQSVFYGFDFRPRVRLPGKAIEQTFKEGIISFRPFSPEHSDKIGLADDTGNVIGMYDYKHIGAMAGGMAQVSKALVPKAAGRQRGAADAEPVTRYGFLNRAGKLAVPLAFEQVADFSGQRATVLIDSGLAMIDESGKIVLQGAWQCGRTPVLMDGKRTVLWPKEARSVTRCKS